MKRRTTALLLALCILALLSLESNAQQPKDATMTVAAWNVRDDLKSTIRGPNRLRWGSRIWMQRSSL